MRKQTACLQLTQAKILVGIAFIPTHTSDFSYMFENFEKDLLIDDGDEDKIPDEFPFEEMDFSKFTGKEDMSKYC